MLTWVFVFAFVWQSSDIEGDVLNDSMRNTAPSKELAVKEACDFTLCVSE